MGFHKFIRKLRRIFSSKRRAKVATNPGSSSPSIANGVAPANSSLSASDSLANGSSHVDNLPGNASANPPSIVPAPAGMVDSPPPTDIVPGNINLNVPPSTNGDQPVTSDIQVDTSRINSSIPMSVETGADQDRITDVAALAAPLSSAGPARQLSIGRQALDLTLDSTTKESLRTAWHGVEMLLGNVEKFLAGTPFHTPIGVINVFIKVGNAVLDNKDALEGQMTRTVTRLRIVNNALLKAEDDDNEIRLQARLQTFAEKLVSEAITLDEMSKRATWKVILDNEVDRGKIDGCFKRIDEHTKDFHLDAVISIERNTNNLQESLFQLRLDSWPRSRNAYYRADLGGTATLARESCTPGTRVDILKHIYQWAENSSSESQQVFWLTGEAGSGKSTIACTVADHFDDDKNDTDGNDTNSRLPCVLRANFFCSRQFEETRRQKNILPTLVYQLARQSRSYAHALLRANKFDSVDVLSKQIKDLLVDPWQKSASDRPPELPPYLVVVDALDEIEGQGGSAFLRDLLTTINDGHLRGLKFLVTSRPDPDLATLCGSFPPDAVCHLYEVPTDMVEDDIATYLNAKLPALLGEPQLSDIVRKADGLFIYAATALRYITPRPKMTKGEQLRLARQLLDHGIPHSSTGPTSPSLVDALYQQILWAAFSALDDEIFRDRLKILHTMLCTEERVPTSVAAILSGCDEKDVADIVVGDLHAVLYIKDGCVFSYHASFPDFIFTQMRSIFTVNDTSSSTTSRIVNMSCDEASHHAVLTRHCFKIMRDGLRFNICNLPSSFLLDSEVPDLSYRVQEKIGDALRYSCRYWVQHLVRATSDNANDLRTFIQKFLSMCVLFWIEAMHLVGSSALCTPMLQRAREWVLKFDRSPSDLAQDIVEAANFITHFVASPAALSTPHMYISSLAIWSKESHMAQGWKKQFSRIPSFTRSKGSSTVPLMTIQTGDVVNSVAFSSDGTRIASGSRDEPVRVWDASTGTQLKALRGHTNSVDSVVFSIDGTRLVSGSHDYSVRVWDASTGVELKKLNGHTAEVFSVVLSSDGTRIVSGSDDKSVRVWDVSTGAELKTLTGHTKTVESVALSSDGTRVLSGSQDHSVRVWDVSTGAELKTLSGHTSGVYCVAFSSDGTHIVSGSEDKTIRLWDASTSTELKTLSGHTNPVRSVAFSSDGARIVSGSQDESVRVWDASTGAELKMLSGHTHWVNSVAFSTDGTRIVSGSLDKTMRVWDASTSAELKTPTGHTDWVNSVAFSSDGSRIVSGSGDHSVQVWDASSGANLKTLIGHRKTVKSAAFSTDGTRIVSGSGDHSVRVWDASTGAELKTLRGHTNSVDSVVFSSDGTRIVSGSQDRSVRVWDASTGAELKTLSGHTSGVYSVAFSSDGTLVVSGSGDDSVRVWDVSTGAELKMLSGHTKTVESVAFSSDGTRIISGSRDKSVRVWDVSTGVELRMMSGHGGTVKSATFSSDGTHIVSGSVDHSVRVWDALTGTELKKLSGHTSEVCSVAFSGDCTRIVSGSVDRSVRVWELGHDVLWISTKENWIVSHPGKDRLLWVPREILEVLEHPHNTLIICHQGSAHVNFQDSKRGTKWAECYTPSLL